MNTLIAKSGNAAPTVAAHCEDVHEAGDAIRAAARADLEALVPALPTNWRALCAAAELLHDVLKANSAYQQMLHRGNKAERQPVRHEVLAAAFLTGDGQLAAWLERLIPDDAHRWAVVWAVAGHHFKMVDPARGGTRTLYSDKGAVREVVVHFEDEQVAAVLGRVAAVFGSASVPALTRATFVTHEDELRDRIDDYVWRAADAWERLKVVPANRALVAVLKALVAAADAAGSALTERNQRPAVWVAEALGRRLTPAELEPVVARDLKGNGPRPFQQRVADSEKSVTVVAAGCGNGKTTAAYLWAQKWANGKKLFFTYPTTGTSTAGYLNYLNERKELNTNLIHGRSAVDLEAMPETHKDEDENQANLQKIESLSAWSEQVVSCTVDTVLGLLQTQRRGTYSFPAFAAGAFVFDEIHAYDAKLWGGLLRFLREFTGAPALLMSASIPPHRRQQLAEVLGDRMGDVVRGDEGIEGHKRYRLESRDDEQACWSEVATALAEGKKVLWVCNTVGDAIRLSHEAKDHTEVTPLVYHSRFRYRDRAGTQTTPGRQKEVIAEFAYEDDKTRRAKPGASLVIATQVCEMSLDISADVLVTAECPLPALVQRLGRLNRYATADDSWPCFVYPFKGLPYNEDPAGVDLDGDCIASMKAARDAVSELDGKPCSQADLAARLDAMHDAEQPECYAALFDDGWVTEPMPVRDGDQSVTVIWERDLSEIERTLGTNRKRWSAGRLAPWTIPMNYPKWLKPFEWDKAGPYPIAPASELNYTEREGAQWAERKPQ
jgi:CRISPR-associated endonuclease/helicase Cas3